MNTRQKIVGLMGTVLICTLMAASSASAVAGAAGLGACALQSFLCAFIAAGVCAAFGFSVRAGIVAVVPALIAAGACLATGISGGLFETLTAGFSAVASGDMTVLQPAGPYIAGTFAAVMAVAFYAFITDNGAVTTAFAVVICLACVIVPGASSGRADIFIMAPALAGCLAAVAHTSEQRRTGGHLMAFIPAALAVAAALLLAPGEGVVWEPLESAAEKIRSVYEDYFNYTSERIAFSISEQGYDYYGLRDDVPTHMLGGPADPETGAVMLVETDDDLLLRGSVRSTYTGYSWEDTSPRARNLYYDFTRRTRRRATFGADIMAKLDRDEAFIPVDGKVTVLSGSSSTIFVPVRLADFDMDLKDAVYYNSVGEMFIARDVEKGDEYSFEAWEPKSLSALDDIARVEDDRAHEDAKSGCLYLPEGIEKGVYSIADALTAECATDAEKVQALMDGLKANCAYATDVEYPPQDRDFVSYFLLDYRKGYCSYFASAMAVLCRAEGIPARYVEGYRVKAEADGVTTVTGEDAHAWVEVYIDGIGWIACDPTPGEDEKPDEQGDNARQDEAPRDEPTAEPTPELPPEGDAEAESTPEPGDMPTTSPEPGQEPSPEPENEVTPPPEHPEMPEDDKRDIPREEKKRGPWLWAALVIVIIALIAAAIWLWVRKRLRDTDPIALAAGRKNDDRAVLILYRALLTLLSHMGHSPMNGESPEAFALRVAGSGMENPEFVEFSRRVALARYSRAGACREDVALGNRAYLRFRRQMKKPARLRFDAYRVLRGLGDFESIP